MFKKLEIFFIGVVLFLSQTELNANDNPRCESLLEDWRKWTVSIRGKFAPYRIEVRYNGPLNWDWNSSGFVETSHCSGQEYFARSVNYFPVDGEKLNRPGAFLTQFYSPMTDTAIALSKIDATSKWYFASKVTGPKTGIYFDRLRFITLIPGLNAINSVSDAKLAELYDFEEIDSTKSDIYVAKYTLKLPKKEPDHVFGNYTSTSFIVEYSQKHNWLPTKLFLDTKELPFTIHREFKEWETIDGQYLPTRVIHLENKDDPNSIVYDLKYESITKVPHDEVAERCTMEFYDLPELLEVVEKKQNSRWRTFTIVGVILFGIIGWLVTRRKAVK